MVSSEHLIWERIAPHRVIHLSDDEKPLMDDGNVLSMLRYLGLEPLKVTVSIHEALSVMAMSSFQNPVGQVREVGVDPDKYADTVDGCFQLLKSVEAAQPKAVLLILPSDKADASFLHLCQTGGMRGRVVVTH